ncbi:MAG: hypothetical protein ABGX27_08805 [Desulfurobacteriaceae bacterium]
MIKWKNEKRKPTYIEGWLRIQISDVEKALRTIEKYNLKAYIHTKKGNTCEIDLNSTSFSIKELISMLQELSSICIPLDSIANILKELEEDDDKPENNSWLT